MPTPPWSLDLTHAHTTHTGALPRLRATDSGLVRIPANGFEFRARVYGLRQRGPAVVLLHGFPGSSIAWESLAPALAAAGYRVLAYDQRGYSPGARPKGSRHYRIADYLSDLRAITEEVGFDTYHLIGHDVGAVVAWGAAMAFPESLASLVTLSIPNPEVLAIRPYVRLLALPWLPELLLRAQGWVRFRRLLPQAHSAAAHDEYRRLFTDPGALTAALNFYRGVNASVAYLRRELSAPIRTPTTFLYGAGEGWVTPAYLTAQRARMSPGVPLEVCRLRGAGDTGHFLLETRPKAVVAEVLRHLTRECKPLPLHELEQPVTLEGAASSTE